jgi:hypothetical protein
MFQICGVFAEFQKVHDRRSVAVREKGLYVDLLLAPTGVPTPA